MDLDKRPYPQAWADLPIEKQVYLQYVQRLYPERQFLILKKVEAEIAQHLRNYQLIEDMKRRFVVSNKEDK